MCVCVCSSYIKTFQLVKKTPGIKMKQQMSHKKQLYNIISALPRKLVHCNKTHQKP